MTSLKLLAILATATFLVACNQNAPAEAPAEPPPAAEPPPPVEAPPPEPPPAEAPPAEPAPAP
jgi:hypothetical protein